MPYAIALDGVRIYYEFEGTGEPLLLIAGQANDHHLWDLVRSDFAKHYQVIVYDLRGTGLSDKPEQPPYTTRGFANDAIAILDAIGLKRAHAYGVSMGGAIAQWLGIDHGDRLGALVLGCSTAGVTHGVRRSEEMQALLAQPNNIKVLDTFFASRWALPQFFFSMRQSFNNPMPQYAERLHAQASQEHDAWDWLPSITVPTLILHGSDDQVTPAANAQLLARRIPHAELYLVRRGRHMFFIEFRKEVSRVVKAFLARHPLAN
jgi:pimeloyl-ACP methyl ester carboxylesterase